MYDSRQRESVALNVLLRDVPLKAGFRYRVVPKYHDYLHIEIQKKRWGFWWHTVIDILISTQDPDVINNAVRVVKGSVKLVGAGA